MKLRRFWFEFDATLDDQPFPGALLGCGVTALDESDALGLIHRRVLGAKPMPAIRKIISDVDISTLDAGHVLPNMMPPHVRGVWFPIGFQEGLSG